MVKPRRLHEQHFQQQPTYVLLTTIQSIYYAHYPLACNPTGPEATHGIAADPLPPAPHNNMQGRSPHAADPEQGQAREQARALQVQPRHRGLDAGAVRHNVQAPVVRHIALPRDGQS